jgi:hypothetical protein
MAYTIKKHARKKANLKKMGANVFYQFIYPILAKQFLLGNDYDIFAKLVSEMFTLSTEQWSNVLSSWEMKEDLLSND